MTTQGEKERRKRLEKKRENEEAITGEERGAVNQEREEKEKKSREGEKEKHVQTRIEEREKRPKGSTACIAFVVKAPRLWW